MPKYDYRCSTCGVVYEKRESFSAPAVQPCQECGAEARRVLTPPAIVFKGSGWYKTDSRGSSSDKSDKSDTATGTETATPDAPADAATPAAKAEPKAESTPVPRTDTKTETKSESKSSTAPAAG